ncbi:zinc-ribbon domain-containing protein [uncultured Methanobrevibacter sp.]|uniref:zinc-ribbon domain-containing protein n=1 Tax=uncultured Methanobrevibacter sp. TaxID=253161 RepID=UPI00260E010E
MVKVCPECHSENIDNALFCGNCGCNLGESSPGANQANSGSTVTVEREDYVKVDNADSPNASGRIYQSYQSNGTPEVEVITSNQTNQNTQKTQQNSSKEYKDVELVNSASTGQNTSNTSTWETIASCCGALIILFIIIWILSAG